MRSRQSKSGHSVVLELRGSLLGSMTFAAVSAELSLVPVIFLVTVDTSLLADLVHIVDMAGAARNRLVFALEGER
jgi:hypothetical protein